MDKNSETIIYVKIQVYFRFTFIVIDSIRTELEELGTDLIVNK